MEFDAKISQNLKPIYSALSIGVHLMSDDECKGHYEE